MPRIALHWQILIAMAIGALAGLLTNVRFGDYAMPEPVEFSADATRAPRKAGGTFWSHDRPGRIVMQIVDRAGDRSVARRFFVGVPDDSMADRPRGRRLDEVAAWPTQPAGSEILETIEPTLDELRGADPAPPE